MGELGFAEEGAGMLGATDDMASVGTNGNNYANQYVIGRLIYSAIMKEPLLAGLAGAPGLYQHGATLPLINQHIPGVVQALQLGQQTGQGAGAGYSRFWNSEKMSFNPFDAITQEMAQRIQEATAQQGFQGTQADDVANATAQMVKGLGIDYTKALELVTANVRNGTLSLKGFLTEMNSLKLVTKDTGMSINNMVDSFHSFTSNATAIGGKSAQVPSANYLNQVALAFPGLGNKNVENPKAWSDWLAQNGQIFAVTGGGSPTTPWSKEGLAAQSRGLQTIVDRITQLRPPGQSWSDFVQTLITTGAAKTFFGDLNAAQIEQVLRTGSSGKFLDRFRQAPGKLIPIPPEHSGSSVVGKIGHWLNPTRGWTWKNAEDSAAAVDHAISRAVHPLETGPDKVWNFLTGRHLMTGRDQGDEQKAIDQLRQSTVGFAPKNEVDLIIAQLQKEIGKSDFKSTQRTVAEELKWLVSGREKTMNEVRVYIEMDPATKKMLRVKKITQTQKIQAKNNGSKTTTTSNTDANR